MEESEEAGERAFSLEASRYRGGVTPALLNMTIQFMRKNNLLPVGDEVFGMMMRFLKDHEDD